MEMDSEKREIFFEVPAEGVTVLDPDIDSLSTARNELEEPRWSVVSFNKRESGGLTHQQATTVMAELDGRKVAGLCIVTDEAAERISG